MLNDKITLKDLSVFAADADESVFGLLDNVTTQEGRDALRKHITHPPDSFEQLQELQDTVKFWAAHINEWPEIISNGTLVMLEKFFESADGAAVPGTINNLFGNWIQRLFNRGEYFFTQFSLSHLSDFLKGCTELVSLLQHKDIPALLKQELEAMQQELDHRLTDDIIKVDKQTAFKDVALLSYKARREMKNTTFRLVYHYARLDAWRSLALATINNKWQFPQLYPAQPVIYTAEQLYHPLLKSPVGYDIDFSKGRNFLVLTGANMSGKTTFMRSLGVGALLAHLGTGVPAESMHISFLHGVITNMHVEDNIMMGESYFFAEVKRMKLTAERLLQPQSNIVLMDELFKGTNVHDAYECTKAVVEGLLNHPNHIMVLSTHLYEVAQHFSTQPGLFFNYFVTQMAENGHYKFTYELKPGISNDRIGYRILQKEGVIALLQNKSSN